MYKASWTVIFVYSLLVIDLLINITDNLLPSHSSVSGGYYFTSEPQLAENKANSIRRSASGLGVEQKPTFRYVTATNISDGTSQSTNTIGSLTFATFIVQILAIVCVVASLLLHFFEVADQLRQSAWLLLIGRQQELPSNRRASHGICFTSTKSNVAPMPLRIALKLVLERYWWSLLVGLMYLVLTIILQIAKLNQSLTRGHFLITKTQITSHSNGQLDWRRALPIAIVLIHKLTSTCYYVSFVVVYRATPGQMVNRILSVYNKKTAASKHGQSQANKPIN